jgi:hypothetical protein
MKARTLFLIALFFIGHHTFAAIEDTDPQQNEITSFTKNVDCKVYPSLVITNLNVDINNSESARVEITNLIGNVYYKKTTNENLDIDLSGLASGMYMVNIYVGDAKITKRIYKQ